MLSSGVSSFSRLHEALKTGDAPDVIFHAFDLLFLAGRDLRSVKLDDRKAMLRALIGDTDDGPLRFCDHHIASGPVFLENACLLARWRASSLSAGLAAIAPGAAETGSNQSASAGKTS